jgi:hypothetical protein
MHSYTYYVMFQTSLISTTKDVRNENTFYSILGRKTEVCHENLFRRFTLFK